MQTEVFSDVLEAGEKIQAILGAPRQIPPGKPGDWIQVALTQERLLVAELRRSPSGGRLEVGRRHAVCRDGMMLERYPRSEEGPARIEFSGMEAPLVLVDVDRPDLFVQLRPFFAAWSGPLGGSGPISLLPESQWGNRFQEPRSRLRPGLLLGLAAGTLLGTALYWGLG